MASYNIQSGDNLWNIVRSNYNVSTNKEIAELVNQIVEDNDIKNPNLIFAGSTIELAETDTFIKKEDDEAKDAEDEKTCLEKKADEFDNWTLDENNYNKSMAGEKVEEFQMFDLDISKYSTDLKEFSQAYVDKYDTSGDGVWDKSEFINMASGGEPIPKGMEKEFNALYDQLFEGLNLDDTKETITAEEYASFLYAADMDWDNYAKTLDVASSLDGKLDYNNYQGLSSLEFGSDAYNELQKQKQEFYDNFYAG